MKIKMELTETQAEVIRRSLHELQINIFDQEDKVPSYEKGTYYCAERLEKKILEKLIGEK
jgi:hypothetical protein